MSEFNVEIHCDKFTRIVWLKNEKIWSIWSKKKTKNLIKIDEIRKIVFSKKTKIESIDVDFVNDSIKIEINSIVIVKKDRHNITHNILT